MKISLLLCVTKAPLEHVMSATAAESKDIKAELLLAQAYEESRFNKTVVSGVKNGKRVSVRTFNFKNARGPYFCGSTQLMAHTKKACISLSKDIAKQYIGSRKHIEEWMSHCVKINKNNMVCALSGYGGGYKGVKIRGRAYHYANRVLRRRNTLNRVWQ